MSKNIWDVFAPVYEFAMRSQKDIYDFMYERIGEVARGKDVLELATGPGMIARHIAPLANHVVATDFAPNFIFPADGKRNLWQKLLSLVGVRFAHEWTEDEYKSFLKGNGWTITENCVIKGRIDLAYVECKK